MTAITAHKISKKLQGDKPKTQFCFLLPFYFSGWAGILRYFQWKYREISVFRGISISLTRTGTLLWLFINRKKKNLNIYASQSTWHQSTLIRGSVFEGNGTDTRWICSPLALVCYSWQHKEGRGYVHKKSKLLFIWTTWASLFHSAKLAFFCCFSAPWQSIRVADRPGPCTKALAL